MELCFKLAAVLLLLIQASHLTLLQTTTDSPGRTIDKGWLREVVNNALGSQNLSVEEPTARDQELDSGGMVSTDDDMTGLPFGSIAFSSGEDEENQGRINGTYDGMTVVTTPMLLPNDMEADMSSAPAAPNTEATQLNPNPSVNNGSNAEGDFQDSTIVPSDYTDQITPNVSTSPKSSNATDLKETTQAPEAHGTIQHSGETDIENNTETTSSRPNVSNTAAPEDGAATSAPLPTSTNTTTTTTTTTTTESPPPETRVDETVPVTMTTVILGTTEESNITDRDGALVGSNTERGLASSSNGNKKNEAWAAILGTAVTVCVIALVIYVILKKKNQKDFSHRKLVEFSSDPVLRLDNSEALDLNYGSGAYYNPALQMDNFQMTSMTSQHN